MATQKQIDADKNIKEYVLDKLTVKILNPRAVKNLRYDWYSFKKVSYLIAKRAVGIYHADGGGRNFATGRGIEWRELAYFIWSDKCEVEETIYYAERMRGDICNLILKAAAEV